MTWHACTTLFYYHHVNGTQWLDNSSFIFKTKKKKKMANMQMLQDRKHADLYFISSNSTCYVHGVFSSFYLVKNWNKVDHQFTLAATVKCQYWLEFPMRLLLLDTTLVFFFFLTKIRSGVIWKLVFASLGNNKRNKQMAELMWFSDCVLP